MPTLSPQEGLSGLESGEALAPERDNVRTAPQTGKAARLAANVAKKVGPLLTAAGLLMATEGCKTDNTPAPTPTPAPAPAPAPTTTGSPFDGAKLVCSNLGLIDDNGTKAAENYRRMFVQTVVSGTPQLYEPCAPSAIPNEMGKFVQADCSNDGQYRNCVVKDSYLDNSYNKVDTETRVKWLLNGHNAVESAQNVGYIFPTGLSARTGTLITALNPTDPVVYGQRRFVSRNQPIPTPPPAPTATAKRLTPPAPVYDPSKDTEQDRRLDNLESQVAQNTAKNNEQDVTLNIHGQLLKILVDGNSKPAGTPHPTQADYDSLGRSRATR